MLSISGLGTTLFLGGWSAPFSFLGWVPSWFWFFSKVMMSICVFIWMRGTLPRLRQDQLMNFAWKFVMPFTLLDLLVAALWRFMGDGWARWGVCSAILLLAYALMGGVGMSRRTLRAEDISLCGVRVTKASAANDVERIAADEYCLLLIAALAVAGGLAAVLLKNTVHCALALTVAFAGLAMMFLELDAQFAGFAQILVYIGAVAILIVFAILLTRGSETPKEGVYSRTGSSGW